VTLGLGDGNFDLSGWSLGVVDFVYRVSFSVYPVVEEFLED